MDDRQDADKRVMAGEEDEQVREEATEDRPRGSETWRGESAGEGVKVTLKQQPRDDKALKGFLSILTHVLQTLSTEKA